MLSEIKLNRLSQIIDRPSESRWLVDQIWADQGVGIIGGEPKCCKSFLAAEIAVCVAGGAKLFGRYQAGTTGRVLYLPAEDSPWAVKERMTGIARARGLEISELSIDLIVAPGLNLSEVSDRNQLKTLVEDAAPKLLILDPFARMSGSNENSSANIAPILDDLRHLQRISGTSIILVHHFRKNNSSTRNGQALRGSSEFHAWGDSNIYMRRNFSGQLQMSVEHRNAAGLEEIPLDLKDDQSSTRLEIREPNSSSKSKPLPDRILELVQSSSAPLSVNQIASEVGVRKQSVCETVREMVEAGKLVRDQDGIKIGHVPDYQQSAVCPWEVMEPVIGNPDGLRG